ncbi:MAG: hypothetical protein EOM31_13075, partial [Bacteroidia bacterium]|nr:hypothetical protein [Bacteroidia bacterium]
MGDAIDLNMGRADTAVSDVVSRATVAENRRMQMAITRRRNKIEQAIAGALDLLSSGRLVNTGQQICCRDEQTLIDYVEQIKVNGEYALDLETTGLDPYCGEIVGFCIYTPNPAENRLYVPVGHTDAEGNIIEGQLPISRVFGILADIFEGDYRYINHMTKFDGKWIKVKYGKWIKNFYWDTWIAAKLLNENEPTHELKPLYAKYILRTRDDASSFADLFGTSIPFNYMPIDVATVYGANDGYKAYKLMEFQRKHIDDERRPDMVKIAKLLHDLE